MEEGFVYILQSQTYGIYYIGSSINPYKRLSEHNSGKTTSTKNKGPWIIKFIRHFPTIAEARKVEYKLKKFKRKDIIEKIIKERAIKNVNKLIYIN